MTRVLVFATTTGYQTRSFGEAALRQSVELVFATDRCHALDDPWRDGAIAVRYHDEQASADAVGSACRDRPVAGVLAVGDRPARLAALVAGRLGLPWHPPEAAGAASNKLLSKEAWRRAGLRLPWYRAVPLDDADASIAQGVPFPCVLKPLALSGSRGVIRADDPASLAAALARLRAMLRGRDVRALRDEADDRLLIESFIPGQEFALEGILERGALRVLAIFDKPDPLDGPFFEETIYVTPSRLPDATQARIVEAVEAAATALGLHHGPVHAECRLGAEGVYVLEVAARPIGGLCARVLRFAADGGPPVLTLEDVLLRHATGSPVARFSRDALASGVMMIPIPRRGVYKGVAGTSDALAVSGVEEIAITAKPDQVIRPLPEGSSYLGFIFARGPSPGEVEEALRAAHTRLRFRIDAAPGIAGD
jgi:hypothetical protein